MASADLPILWLDMEMTGLDPQRCVPLQIAGVITRSSLEEEAAVEVTIWQPEEELARMPPVVREMHAKNGLIEQVRASRRDTAYAERALLEVVAAHAAPGAAVLAGNSIHQDRRFLARYFPALEGYLHYRMIDVSSIKELVRRWYGKDATYSKGDVPHTALADIRTSLDELRYYRQHYFQ